MEEIHSLVGRNIKLDWSKPVAVVYGSPSIRQYIVSRLMISEIIRQQEGAVVRVHLNSKFFLRFMKELHQVGSDAIDAGDSGKFKYGYGALSGSIRECSTPGLNIYYIDKRDVVEDVKCLKEGDIGPSRIYVDPIPVNDNKYLVFHGYRTDINNENCLSIIKELRDKGAGTILTMDSDFAIAVFNEDDEIPVRIETLGP